MAGNDVDIWPPPQELKSTLNAWPKVRKSGEKNTAKNVVKPWLFKYSIRGYTLLSYIGIVINHYKTSYEPTRIK